MPFNPIVRTLGPLAVTTNAAGNFLVEHLQISLPQDSETWRVDIFVTHVQPTDTNRPDITFNGQERDLLLACIPTLIVTST